MRWRRIFKSYGLTKDQWWAMYESQGGKCAISGRPLIVGKEAHVDHDHVTGEVRALLDGKINVALGVFDHNPDWLRRAADYIEQHQHKARLVA